MAKVYHNEREHLVIQMNASEATECNFGIEIPGINNLCICDACNAECKPSEIYYIAGINEVMCGDCIEDYVKNMNHYVDDDSLTYEVRHFNKVAETLNMNERAAVTPNGKCVIYDASKVKEEQLFTYI